MNYIERAARVLRDEAQAIEKQIDALDQNFLDAVQLILASPGRVICTGMGKSGHIARKVAATLSSTGTPAMYLHPGEGIHGDLGMVTKEDIILAFSHSGETIEVLNILPSVRRIGAKIIAVVGNPNSTLAKIAEVVLLVAVTKEACPLGLAPTTSTTTTLALGDALAIVLLEQHRFTEEEFAIFHPGGALGQKLLLRVEHVMHKDDDNPTVVSSATVREALFTMTGKGLGATSVIDEKGHLIGLVTDGDIRRGLEAGNDLLNWPVEAMMTKEPRRILQSKLAAAALHMMENNQPRPITVLPVVDEEGKCVGMIHITDLLRRGIV